MSTNRRERLRNFWLQPSIYAVCGCFKVSNSVYYRKEIQNRGFADFW